jgi:hypothetical protein
VLLSVAGALLSMGVSGTASATFATGEGQINPPGILASFMSGGVTHAYEFDSGRFTTGPLAGATFEEWGLATITPLTAGPNQQGTRHSVSNDVAGGSIYATGQGTLQGEGACGINTVVFWFTAQYGPTVVRGGTMHLGVPFQGDTIYAHLTGNTFTYDASSVCGVP